MKPINGYLRKYRINKKRKKDIIIGGGIFLVALVFLFMTQVYLPKSFTAGRGLSYYVQSGVGLSQIAKDLQQQGIIKSSFWFNAYSFLSGNHAKLQAGLYDFSPSMSVASIVNALAKGAVVRNKITLLEGWDGNDIGKYFESKGIFSAKEFNDALKADYSSEFPFLKDKPKSLGLEGYIFPDTYLVASGISPKDFIRMALRNFGQRLTPELRTQIASQDKSIFQIVTMASILEKEVRTLDDKKTVSGILWKRIANGVPLQVDCTINYITDKNDASATLADLKIDSLYNTYKYPGLPHGPISSPGMDSIMAAINPAKTAYWFYLSAPSGQTIYSKTFAQHQAAIATYLKNLTQK